jgi:hypothetical protein
MIRKRILIKILIAGFFALLLLAILLIFNKRLLSKNHPVEAHVLVVEGWLPPYVLELIPQKIDLSNYTTIYVTGLIHNNRPQYLFNDRRYEVKKLPAALFTNGCVCLSKSALKKLNAENTISEIKVYTYGSKAKNIFAHFFCAVGDSIIGQAFTTEQPFAYAFRTGLTLSTAHNLYISQTNDLQTSREDRNLFIDSVSVNGIVFNRPSDFCLLYDDHANNDSTINYPFHSKSEAATAYLKALGLKNNIVVVDSFYNYRNRTLITAEQFDSYIKKYNPHLEAINVVSIQKHSRRSYLAYKIATSGRIKVGIISFDSMGLNRKTRPFAWLGYILLEYAKIFVMSAENLYLTLK